MHAILIRGLSRSPLSMLLRAHGRTTHLVGCSAVFEGWHSCVRRLQSFIAARTRGERFFVVGR
jgi:hypothetical protein